MLYEQNSSQQEMFELIKNRDAKVWKSQLGYYIAYYMAYYTTMAMLYSRPWLLRRINFIYQNYLFYVFDLSMSMIENEFWKDVAFNNSEVRVDFTNSLSNEAPNDDYTIN